MANDDLQRANMHRERANSALEMGLGALAETEAREALKYAPHDAASVIALGKALLHQDKVLEAHHLVIERMQSDLTNPEAQLFCAQVLYRAGDQSSCEEAAELLRMLCGLSPNWTAAFALLALVEIVLGQYGAALHASKRACELAPDDRAALTAMIRSLLAAGASGFSPPASAASTAEPYVRKLLDKDPTSAEAQQMMLQVLRELRRFGEASTLAEQWLVFGPSNAALWAELAAAQHALGKLDAAQKSIAQALRWDPDSALVAQIKAQIEGKVIPTSQRTSNIETIEEISEVEPDEDDDVLEAALRSSGCPHDSLVVLNPHAMQWQYRCLRCQHTVMCECDKGWADRGFVEEVMVFGSSLNDSPTFSPKSNDVLGYFSKICAVCRGVAAYPVASTGESSQRYDIDRRARAASIKSAVAQTAPSVASAVPPPALPPPAFPPPAWPTAQASDPVSTRLVSVTVGPQPTKKPRKPQEKTFLATHEVPVFLLDIEGVVTQLAAAEHLVCHFLEHKGMQSIPLFRETLASLVAVFLAPVLSKELFVPDFATPSYWVRHQAELERYLATLPKTYDELEALYDRLRPTSKLVLSAFRAQENEESAKTFLPWWDPNELPWLLRFIFEDFERRAAGWPTFFLVNTQVQSFAYIQHSKGRLTDEQRGWIEDNASRRGWRVAVYKLA